MWWHTRRNQIWSFSETDDSIQFSRLLATELCASALVMLDTPCSEVAWRVLATHSICQFPLYFPSVRHRVPSAFNWTVHIFVSVWNVVWVKYGLNVMTTLETVSCIWIYATVLPFRNKFSAFFVLDSADLLSFFLCLSSIFYFILLFKGKCTE